jgi:peptidoglycan/LPS O-acetylase OafA/YrhL
MRTPRSDAPAAGARPRLDALDGLRGLAALAIVVLHVWMYTYGDAGHPPKHLLDFAIGELRLGVAVFFLLSGYLLYRPFVTAALDGRDGPDLRAYALRRAARILPAYWATLALAFFLLRALDHPMQIDAAQLPIFLAFLENHFEQTAGRLDPPMWTLAVEAAFYAFLPVAGAAALRLGGGRGRQLAAALAVVAGGVVATVLATELSWPDTVTNSLPLHLADFGAGMTVAVLVHRRTVGRAAAIALLAAGAALIVANSSWHALELGSLHVRRLVADVPGIAGFALVVGALVASPVRARLLASRPARWLGSVSYGMYLVHYLVIFWLRSTDRWPETLGRALVTTLAITVPLAIISYNVIERPAMLWARRRLARRRAPTPARAAAPRVRTGALRPQPAER